MLLLVEIAEKSTASENRHPGRFVYFLTGDFLYVLYNEVGDSDMT